MGSREVEKEEEFLNKNLFTAIERREERR